MKQFGKNKVFEKCSLYVLFMDFLRSKTIIFQQTKYEVVKNSYWSSVFQDFITFAFKLKSKINTKHQKIMFKLNEMHFQKMATSRKKRENSK